MGIQKILTPIANGKVGMGEPSQPAFTCSNLTIEILEEVVNYVQSSQ